MATHTDNAVMVRRPVDPEFIKIVSRNVRRLREQRGWSQEELNARAAIAGSVKQIEAGKQGARADTLVAIANALNVSLDELVYDSTAPPRPELVEFLKTPSAADVTDEEIECLKRAFPRGKRPNAAAYYVALQSLRLAERESKDDKGS